MSRRPRDAGALQDDDANASAGSQTVSRAMLLLRMVACGQERGVRLTDLVAMTGMNQPTVHRLLQTLVREGAIEQNPANRHYRIGPEIPVLALARSHRFPLMPQAEPYLTDLAQQVGDTVFLSVRHGTDSICVARKTGHYAIQVLSIEVGVRRPLGIGVSGIAMLSCMPPDQSDALIHANARRIEVLKENPHEISRRVQVARETGIAHAPQGLMPGTSAVAVPVRGVDGQALAAITITAIAERLNERRLPQVVALMRERALWMVRRHAEMDHVA
ncbi:IclR family transcriptional regulator [Bordetella genomosp. 9]|uniref:IclR family transcriptional regulator n=1 Tax=Bordetella genomosp. 9 TaxID=1416803 RepID=UPI000A292493|nr:IclR family transcriptional regulator [Bordetella genomosp. 9]ARP89393.1 IclR family transcriptional regulator [Bordetella genomosp. 9]